MNAVTAAAPVSQLLDIMEALIRSGPGADWVALPVWAEGAPCPADHLWEAGMSLHRGDVASELESAGIVLWSDGDPKSYAEDRPGLVWEVPLACRVIYSRALPASEAESMRGALGSLFCADLVKEDPAAASKAIDRLTGAGVRTIKLTDVDCSKYEDLRNRTQLDFTFTVRCMRAAEPS